MRAEEGEALKQAWLRLRPEAGQYFTWVNRQLDYDRKGTFSCLASGRLRGGVGFCDGANNAFQALTAWGAKAALYDIIKACYLRRDSALYGCRVVNFAHDEIFTELPVEQAHEAALEQTRIQIEAMQNVIPDVPITAEPALMRHWSKAAEPSYDSRGRLVPWDLGQNVKEVA